MSIRLKATVFLGLAFGITWTASFLAWRFGMRELQGGNGQPIFALALIGPLIAAVVCTAAFERGQWRKALGLRFTPNWWWLVALLLPLSLGLIALITNIVIAGGNLFVIEDWKEPFARLIDASMARQVSSVGVGFVVGILYNLLSEELGWRGYLYHIWRDQGFWHYTIATGLLWGAWHWPMILLLGMGGDQGPVFNFFFYPVATTLLSFCQTIIRDRSHSVIATGIFHGTWNSVSQMQNGIYSVFSVLALAMAIFAWRQRKSGTEPLKNNND